MFLRIKHGKKEKQIILVLILVSFTAFSCVTQKRVEYLQDRSATVGTFNEAGLNDYRLKPNDELFIQISSLDEAAANVFSGATSQQILNAGTMQPYGASLMSYSVDTQGYLLLPVIGRIIAKGKTISDISIEIRDSLQHILNQPVVSVKLVNRYVSILGEVNNPGHFAYSQDKLTIYDAIGLAGDITEYGNRNELILIRNENGINSRLNLDLTKSDILSSGYYNLRPNDIIYVKPLRNKFWGMRQFPFTVLFSALTTGILLYSVVK
ncbi:MAG TPA: polysaccharide biosynthesis/export family protein [Bacteroidales bacterium]|nr:polysaccharide biosynthesis/export family protein [Bacteroidales bacterium]